MTVETLTGTLLNWASVLDEATREQAITTSRLSFVYPHVALMPDAHLGTGATVGSVIPTDRALVPAAVGVDLGCGMIAVRTQWTAEDLRRAGRLGELRESIERRVPLSPGKYNRKIQRTAEPRLERLRERWDREVRARFGGDPEGYARHWEFQLGSLGGGNHFIEVVADEEDRVWAFLHSGSRGIGNKIAQRHIRVARGVAERYWIDLPHRDLAYLVEGTEEFERYVAELGWAQEFALLNREEMMDRTLMALARHLDEDLIEETRVNCHHNFTQKERHFGRDLWVSRKGAIEAREGQLGLIPGSMGTASYVVAGRGDPRALSSAPHGAGRVLSRTAARKAYTVEDLRASMGGIEFRDSAAFVDEIPAAYKDIDTVMADAEDLVRVVHRFRQIVNVKGQ
ncbi:RtcB family protein [Brevibacterium litoralis]|uniref:RtcB family protein n=1 Tax=Brevibacterium litoralis TaxID=3138935 RepID=UPI0032EC1D6B